MKIMMCYNGVLAAAGGASEEGIDIAEDKTFESLLHQVADRRGSDVALGRALALRPHTLLLDEPLSALDEETREDMQRLLKSVQEHFHVTTLHVTHSRHEAAQLADCLFQIRDGKVEAPG